MMEARPTEKHGGAELDCQTERLWFAEVTLDWPDCVSERS